MKKNRFFNKVNDIPLNFKFLIIYVVCLLIPIIAINVLFYNRFSKTVDEREMNNYKISLERTKVDINTIIEGCISVSHSISTDKSFYALFDKSYDSYADYYETYDANLRNKLNLYSDVYDYIGKIGLYVDNPTILSGGSYFITNDNIKGSVWYKAIKSSNQSVLLQSYIWHTDSSPVRQIPLLSVLRIEPVNLLLGSIEKVLKVDVDLDRITSILKRESEYLNLCLVDQQNNIICSSTPVYDFYQARDLIKFNPDLLGKDNLKLETAIGTTSYLSGWKLIGGANMKRISDATRDTLNFVLPLAGVSVFISSILILIIVRSYNYRLKKLSKHLKLAGEQFDLIDINEGKDEIGAVVKNFNLMAIRINNLINDVYKLELQKKDLELERVRAELNYLQSQMNPHFLFNTLNALLVVSVKKNYTDIADVLKYLSKTLRRLLSWKDDLVPVEEEINFTEMYLKIEKFRFGAKFEYSIEADESLMSYRIPKLSLQPLVENACVHGIQAIKCGGKIEIRFSMEEDGLLVSVRDNGTGMDGNKLAELRANVKSDEEVSANIGVRNVYRRLKLYYGDEITFDIGSRVNEGTSVSFVIPAQKLQIGEAI